MEKRTISPADVTPAVGGYSHGCVAVRASELLFISGQIPEDANGGVPDDFEGQCRAVWENIGKILRDAGMSIENLVKVTTFLTARDQVVPNREVRTDVLGEHAPALTVVVVETLDSRWLLEIEAVAAA